MQRFPGGYIAEIHLIDSRGSSNRVRFSAINGLTFPLARER